MIKTMFKQIQCILKYVLNSSRYYEETENTHLEVKITEKEDNIAEIRMDAIAPWIKDIHVHSMLAELNTIEMTIHHGDCLNKYYNIYKITYGINKERDVLAEVENEPFLPDGNYYLSFVIEVDNKLLYNLVPQIAKYIKVVQQEPDSIQIVLNLSSGINDEYCNRLKYTKMISEAIGTVMQYSLSDTREIRRLLNVKTTDEAVAKLKILTEETLENTT